MNRDCPGCGSGFSVKYNSSTQKFCSRSCACRYNAQRRVGEKNPNWRGGVTNHLLYETYQDMIARCYRVTHHAFDRYGGRGIIVDESWRESFEQFCLDRPEGYEDMKSNFNKKAAAVALSAGVTLALSQEV